MNSHQEILTKYWGHKQFRPLQEEIILSVLDKRDTLALLPTGGGKSICYQVPALAQEGICLVISPLIALMKDQVESLLEKGINAISITSMMSKRETDLALDNCIYGKIKLLYVSPERLLSPLFLARLEKMKLNLIAADEAHCISQWGYDFRPSYLQIAEIRKYHPDVPVIALTATATPTVTNDIREKLLFNKKSSTLKSSFARENLSYQVYYEDDKRRKLVDIIKKEGGSGIIYVRTRKKTKEIATYLQQNKIQADFYHAGLKPFDREKKQDEWKKSERGVIVATNAFGMGIDKADVRFVIHLDIPDSIEAYFQEAGRAGRDGKKAVAIILFQEANKTELKELLVSNFPEQEEIRQIYQALANYYQVATGAGEKMSFNFDIADFCDHYNLKALKVFNCLRFLEREGYIALSEGINQPSRIHISALATDLYTFQLENSHYDAFLKVILRSYPGIFDQFVKIDESRIAKRWGHSREEVIKILNLLNQRKVLNYIPETNLPQVTFVIPRVDAMYVSISKQNWLNLKKLAYERAEAMLKYTGNTKRCRSQQLLEYFGEINSKACGICDVCTGAHKTLLSDKEFQNISARIKTILKGKPRLLKELVNSIEEVPEIKTLKVIRWMLDNEVIRYGEEEKLVYDEIEFHKRLI